MIFSNTITTNNMMSIVPAKSQLFNLEFNRDPYWGKLRHFHIRVTPTKMSKNKLPNRYHMMKQLRQQSIRVSYKKPSQFPSAPLFTNNQTRSKKLKAL